MRRKWWGAASLWFNCRDEAICCGLDDGRFTREQALKYSEDNLAEMRLFYKLSAMFKAHKNSTFHKRIPA